MRILKKIGWALLIGLVVLALSVGLFMYNAKPVYSGEKHLSTISEDVEVYFDTYGIPHIYGQSETDTFTALGYVHAQDRLWQMELLRRIGRGGISEVFGRDFIGTDKFFLALGIDDASTRTVAQLDTSDKSVRLSQAYLDGINQFIEEGPTPIEFHLTGIDKTEFTLKDVYNTLGYMAFSFAMAHKTDPLLTDIRDKLGSEYLNDLQIGSHPESVFIKNHYPDTSITLKNEVSAHVMKSLEKLSIPLFEGSNSWVIAPEKTKKGKVIFANDPHIGFSQPSVWYEAHVSTPSYEKYGYHLAGVPFPLLGHNRKLAYGMTMFENDDVDFYYEENHPSDSTKYKTEKGWAEYKVISKTIKVKDSSDIQFSYKNTVRGPVMNGIADQIKGERPIAMWWAYTQLENTAMEGLFGMSQAENIEEFRAALPKIHAPGLNIMYGDSAGNVAWWATAKLYKIPDTVDTKFVYDFGEGLSKELDFLGFSENPKAINPPWQYVYSANNQPDSIAGMLYPGYYLPDNRAKRIITLLEPKNDWDAKAVRDMMNDVTSPTNIDILTNLLKDIDTEGLTNEQISVLDKLQYWKGDYPLSSIEATMYHRWIYFLLESTFEDELGEEQFEGLLGTHLVKRLIAPLSGNTTSVWWDDIATKEITETKKDIVNASFVKAWENLAANFGKDIADWTWANVHTLEHGHPIGQIAALRAFFNVGPFPVNGTREVINNMAFPYTENGVNKVSSGPSTRRVIDFSDIENSMSILPTGQSGNPFSKHYKDQADMFVNGKYRKMMMNEKEIKETSEAVLIFRPKK
ncbi:MAG: penicillin acylase family protein [Pricia sp.]